MSARAPLQEAPAIRLSGTRGPLDDFFCHKYSVWYRVEDCLYRSRNQTYSGCANCFQGHLNRDCVEQGISPPVVLPPDRVAALPRTGPADVIPLRRKD